MMLFWSSVSIGGRFIMWILRWSLILTLLTWVVLPASVTVIGSICLASLLVWAASAVRTAVIESRQQRLRTAGRKHYEDTVFFDVMPGE